MLRKIKFKKLYHFYESNIYYGNLDDNENWDQFELNKNKFNVNSTYDERHYTREINYGLLSDKILKNAEIVEKLSIFLIEEIKSIIDSSNLHLLEERALIDQSDGNEEDKYSSVIRQINH